MKRVRGADARARQDNTSYPEALKRANGLADPKYDAAKCNLYLCKGFQFEDNKAGVQSYTAGQTIDMEVYIRIPHKGYANVSVVDLHTNSVIGAPLKTWADNYAASMNNPKDQTTFSVKLPELAGKCTKPGDCVRFSLPPPPSPSFLGRATQGDVVLLTAASGGAVVLVRTGSDVRVVHRLHRWSAEDGPRLPVMREAACRSEECRPVFRVMQRVLRYGCVNRGCESVRKMRQPPLRVSFSRPWIVSLDGATVASVVLLPTELIAVVIAPEDAIATALISMLPG